MSDNQQYWSNDSRKPLWNVLESALVIGLLHTASKWIAVCCRLKAAFREGRNAALRRQMQALVTLLIAAGGPPSAAGDGNAIDFDQQIRLVCLGLDHERLTYRFQGRHYRLTDVFGHVVRDILA